MLSKVELSPESLSSVIEQSTDCVKFIGPHGELLWMNPNGLCAMEIDDISNLSGKEWASLWPENSQGTIRAALADASAGRVARLEAFCPTLRGAPRWWEVSISAVRGADGAHAGYISVSRDISQLHADREALKVLLSEMRHRLKNSFAMVCAMLRSLARGDAANTIFADEMIARISALATAQTLFDGECDVTDLHDLLLTLISPFKENGMPIVTVHCPEHHQIDRTIADVISLVIGELTVNSTKHGAIGHGGKVTLTASGTENEPENRPENGTENGIFILTWHEDSQCPVQSTSRKGGQGLTLIQRICAARGGNFHIDWQDNGLIARLTLPNQNAERQP